MPDYWGNFSGGGVSTSSGGGGSNSRLWPDFLSNNPVSEQVGHWGDFLSHNPITALPVRAIVGPHQAVDFLTHDWIASLYGLGKLPYRAAKSRAEHGIGGVLLGPLSYESPKKFLHDPAEPLGGGFAAPFVQGYNQKYQFTDFWQHFLTGDTGAAAHDISQVGHNIAQDPFGTALDVTVAGKALGTAHLSHLERGAQAARLGADSEEISKLRRQLRDVQESLQWEGGVAPGHRGALEAHAHDLAAQLRLAVEGEVAGGKYGPGSWRDKALTPTRTITSGAPLDEYGNPYEGAISITIPKRYRARSTQGRLMQTYIDDLRMKVSERIPGLPGAAHRLVVGEEVAAAQRAFTTNAYLFREAERLTRELPEGLQYAIAHVAELPRDLETGTHDPIGNLLDFMKRQRDKFQREAEAAPKRVNTLRLRAIDHQTQVLERVNAQKDVIYGFETAEQRADPKLHKQFQELHQKFRDAYVAAHAATESLNNALIDAHLAWAERLSTRARITARLMHPTNPAKYEEGAALQDPLGQFTGTTHTEQLARETGAIENYYMHGNTDLPGGEHSMRASEAEMRRDLEQRQEVATHARAQYDEMMAREMAHRNDILDAEQAGVERPDPAALDWARTHAFSSEAAAANLEARIEGGARDIRGTHILAVHHRDSGGWHRYSLGPIGPVTQVVDGRVVERPYGHSFASVVVDPDGQGHLTDFHIPKDIRTHNPEMVIDFERTVLAAFEEAGAKRIVPDPSGMTDAGAGAWRGLVRRINRGHAPGWRVEGTLEKLSGEGGFGTYGGQEIVRDAVQTPHNPLAQYGPAWRYPHVLTAGPTSILERNLHRLPRSNYQHPEKVLEQLLGSENRRPGESIANVWLNGMLNANPEVLTMEGLKHWETLRAHDVFNRVIARLSGKLEDAYKTAGGKGREDYFIFTDPEASETGGQLWAKEGTKHMVPRKLHKLDTETEHEWVIRLDKMGVRRVHKSYIEAWEKEASTGRAFLNRFVHGGINQVWRYLLLGIKPSWAVNNFFTNQALVLLHNAGRGGLRAFLAVVMDSRGVRRLRKLWAHTKANFGLSDKTKQEIDDLFNEKLHPRIHTAVQRELPPAHASTFGRSRFFNEPKGGKGVGPPVLKPEVAFWKKGARTYTARKGLHELDRITRGMVEKINQAGEEGGRNQAVLAKLHQMTGQVVKTGDDFHRVTADFTEEQWAELLLGEGGPMNTLGDYSRLSAAERNYVLAFMPFYPWYKTILGISARYVARYPERLWILHALASGLAQTAEQDMALGIPVPSFARDLVPLFGKDGKYQLTIGSRTWNPFQTPIDIGTNVHTALTKGPTSVTPNEVGLGLFGPVVQGTYSGVTGQDPFYGGKYSGWGAGHGVLGNAFGSQFSGLPQQRLWSQLTGGYKSKVFEAPSDRDQQYVALLQYLGLPVRYVNRPNLAQRAAEEQGVPAGGGGGSGYWQNFGGGG